MLQIYKIEMIDTTSVEVKHVNKKPFLPLLLHAGFVTRSKYTGQSHIPKRFHYSVYPKITHKSISFFSTSCF